MADYTNIKQIETRSCSKHFSPYRPLLINCFFSSSNIVDALLIMTAVNGLLIRYYEILFHVVSYPPYVIRHTGRFFAKYNLSSFRSMN